MTQHVVMTASLMTTLWMTQHVVMTALLMTTLWMTLCDRFVERSSLSRSVIGYAVITQSVSSAKRLDVLRQKPIMLVTQIIDCLLERCVTIAENIMFFERIGINVLC